MCKIVKKMEANIWFDFSPQKNRCHKMTQYILRMNNNGFAGLKSKAFLALVTKAFFLSFCESTLIPKAVLAITSIV